MAQGVDSPTGSVVYLIAVVARTCHSISCLKVTLWYDAQQKMALPLERSGRRLQFELFYEMMHRHLRAKPIFGFDWEFAAL